MTKNSSGILEEAVEKLVVKQLIDNIDVEGMAKRLAPKVEKAVEASIMEYLNNDDDLFYEIISESIDSKAWEAMRRHLSGIIVGAFKARKAV